MSIFLLFAFNLTQKASDAGSLPQFYWGDANGGRLYFAPVDLGIVFGSEWEIIVKTNVDMTSAFGFGFRNYNVLKNEAVQTIFADDNWAGEAIAFQWLGEGTPAYYSLTNATQGITYLTTTLPPADASAPEGDRR